MRSVIIFLAMPWMRWFVGGSLAVFLLLPVWSFGQTDAYIVELVEEEEHKADVEEETFTISEPEFSIQGPTSRRDPGRIGAARADTRRGRGGSTMLRYDQHRELSPPDRATLRLGPWYTDIGLSLSAGYRYTRFRGRRVDFIDGVRRGEVQEGGSEFPLSATLTMNNYMILTHRLDLSLNLRMSYFHYPLGTQADRFDIDLTDEGIFATFSTQFHPTRDSRVLLYDDILYLTDFVDRRGISDRLGGREFRLLQNTVGADWDWNATSQDAFSASVSRIDTLPQSSTFRSQRRVRYAQMASYRRQFNSYAAGGVLLQGSQSLAQTSDRPDTYTHGYRFFTGWNLTPSIDVDAFLGQQFSVVQGGLLDSSRSSQTVTASAIVDHDLREGRSQRFAAARTVSESFEGGVELRDDFSYRYNWSGLWLPGDITSEYLIVDPIEPPRNGYQNWDNRIRVRTQLTRRIPLDLSASYAMRFNEAGVGVDDDPEISNDYQTLSLMARTGFRVSRKINFSAYVQHVDRTADNRDLAFSRDTLGLEFIWRHQF